MTTGFNDHLRITGSALKNWAVAQLQDSLAVGALWLVGLYITAAYWFTSSTSFANPAVAIARSMTNTFSGIRPVDLPGFVAGELCGAVAALMLMSWLLREGEGAQSRRRLNFERDDLSQS